MNKTAFAVLAVLVCACDSKTSDLDGGVGGGGVGGGAGGAGGGGAADAGIVERGPKTIAVDGDPNGLWWDAASQTLYLADDNNNRVLKWTDQGGFSVVAVLPTAPASGPGLGQLAFLADGTIVVVRFGGGTAGDVVIVRPDGGSGVVLNLPVDRRRIGLAVAADGSLYDSYFVRNANVNIGSIAKLDIAAGTEVEVVGALGKTVGVLAVGNDLFFTDQTAGKVHKAPLSMPSQYTTLATIANADLLHVGPNGSLLMGSRDGKVFQISSSGAVSELSNGYQQVHGIAWDEANKRLFIADHDGDPTNGLKHNLQIIPLP